MTITTRTVQRYIPSAAIISGLCVIATTTHADVLQSTPLADDGLDPLHVFSWHPLPDGLDHLTYSVRLWPSCGPEGRAAKSLELPEGRRVLISHNLEAGLLEHPQDVCVTPGGTSTLHAGIWPEHGVDEVKEWYENFFPPFKDAGGKVDALFLDFEDQYSNWRISSEGGVPRWQAIENDPRITAIKEVTGIDDLSTAYYATHPSQNFKVWNAHMTAHVSQALNDAVYDIASESFPNVASSNYFGRVVDPEYAIVTYNGIEEWYAEPCYGTHQSSGKHGALDDALMERYGVTADDGELFSYFGFLHSIYASRSLLLSSDIPYVPWIAPSMWIASPAPKVVAIADSPYYDEHVMHLSIQGAKNMVYWNQNPWAGLPDPENWNNPADAYRLDDVFDILHDRLDGGAYEPVKLERVPPDEQLVASAARVGDTIVWRLTVAPGIAAIEMTLNGQPVQVQMESTRPGAWFTHDADADIKMSEDGHGPAYSITDTGPVIVMEDVHLDPMATDGGDAAPESSPAPSDPEPEPEAEVVIMMPPSITTASPAGKNSDDGMTAGRKGARGGRGKK